MMSGAVPPFASHGLIAAVKVASMMRASLLLALLLAACSGSDDNHIVDGAKHIDAPADSAGSGSDSMAALDPHPHDNKLELLVAGLSVIVVLGPIHGARRKRNIV
jgi:hypothetical protein